MATFDSIINEGDWIGEHYFTSDGKQSFAAHVTARVKAWKEADADSPLTRFSAARGGIESALVNIAQASEPDEVAARELHATYQEVLGYRGAGFAVTADGDVTSIGAHGLSGASPLAILDARPADAVEDLRDKERVGLWSPFEAPDATTTTSLPARISHLFAQSDAPKYVLALAGRWALVTEAARWAEGRYLAVDLQTVAERNDSKRGGEIETALTIIAADSLAPDAEGNVAWSTIIEDSVKHTVGVSKDLREGVRLSIEIIANDVVSRRARQHLEPLPASEAQALAKQSLRYLYRILFLLYAEASAELKVLPVGTPEYDAGYSLDRLRELVLADLATDQARNGTHLYQSLDVLFRLVDSGHTPPSAEATDGRSDALTFHSLRADLFLPSAISHISDTHLGNEALKQVLEHLLLSKERTKQDRGFISYAELGINQLGAVYEGLMSYTGFFAEEDLFEVAKNGDAAKGSWVVPTHRASGIAESDFVRVEDPLTREPVPVVHSAGTFVFRLAGRERQQSASFYTPEVLTRFTVGQALAELLDQDGKVTTAKEILGLTVCEPALGSGAFAIEATRQLAGEYLKRRQEELEESVKPEDYQRELQRAKAYIALHNVYGVDLNSTAVELAEISLWLDTMVEGLDAPWFGLHLRRGNSLIGARCAVYSRNAVNSRAWLSNPPDRISLGEREAHEIYHFLLPADGWGAGSETAEARELMPRERAQLNEWRKEIKRRPSRGQIEDLLELSYRIDTLWSMSAKRLEMANAQARRTIPVWGHADERLSGGVSREQIEGSLGDPDSAYRRVKAVMDAWCSLWFWPIVSTTAPPSLDEWIATCFALLGRAPEARTKSRLGSETLVSSNDWDELNDAEETDLGLAGAKHYRDVLTTNPWMLPAAEQAQRQGFFHWEFEFAPIFESGGFDLQVGNPPWVRPDWDEAAALGEFDARWTLSGKIPESVSTELRLATLAIPGATEYYLEDSSTTVSTRNFVSSITNYPALSGLRPDLYRCFMIQTWNHAAAGGISGLIHPDTHFTDEKAGSLRALAYSRLRRHWVFENSLRLFEVDSKTEFGVQVYGECRDEVRFANSTGLRTPTTLEGSLRHDGAGQEPGTKDDAGNWDLRPHAGRVSVATQLTLASWHAALETGTVPIMHTRMLYTANQASARVLEKLSSAHRIRELELDYSQGWNETTDFASGRFVKSWRIPDSWDRAILQGPHLYVSTPLYKSPNPTLKSNQDWSAIDLEAIGPSYIPPTAYQPAGDRDEYDSRYTHWTERELPSSARNYYRIAWRRMAKTSNERTLMPAILPPGAAHVDGVFSAGGPRISAEELMVLVCSMSAIVVDFALRASGKTNLRSGAVEWLPRIGRSESSIRRELVSRAARLHCVTSAFAELWQQVEPASGPWSPASSPARIARERRRLQVEIDALVALALGVTAEELCTVYRTEFAVLRKYDQQNHYDANGRLVTREIVNLFKTRHEALTDEERTVTHPGSGVAYTYEFPFAVLDREADMRAAYTDFERQFRESE